MMLIACGFNDVAAFEGLNERDLRNFDSYLDNAAINQLLLELADDDESSTQIRNLRQIDGSYKFPPIMVTRVRSISNWMTAYRRQRMKEEVELFDSIRDNSASQAGEKGKTVLENEGVCVVSVWDNGTACVKKEENLGEAFEHISIKENN